MLWQRAVVLSGALPAEYPFLDNPIAGAGFWIGRLTAVKVLARYLWLGGLAGEAFLGLLVFGDSAGAGES